MASGATPGSGEVLHAAQAPDRWTRTLEVWSRDEECSEQPLFWGPHRSCRTADWVRVRNVEHLAVLVSTANGHSNNVCFVSGTPRLAPRRVNLIGLIGRQVLGWAVVVHDPERGAHNVQRREHPHAHYDSFSALSAAVVARTWMTTGRLPEGLVTRRRKQ